MSKHYEFHYKCILGFAAWVYCIFFRITLHFWWFGEKKRFLKGEWGEEKWLFEKTYSLVLSSNWYLGVYLFIERGLTIVKTMLQVSVQYGSDAAFFSLSLNHASLTSLYLGLILLRTLLAETSLCSTSTR